MLLDADRVRVVPTAAVKLAGGITIAQARRATARSGKLIRELLYTRNLPAQSTVPDDLPADGPTLGTLEPES